MQIISIRNGERTKEFQVSDRTVKQLVKRHDACLTREAKYARDPQNILLSPLSTRLRNCLACEGYVTFSQLHGVSIKQLRKMTPNLGRHGIEELRLFMADNFPMYRLAD